MTRKQEIIVSAVNYINDLKRKGVKIYARSRTITSFLRGTPRSPFYHLFKYRTDVCGQYQTITEIEVLVELDKLVKSGALQVMGVNYSTPIVVKSSIVPMKFLKRLELDCLDENIGLGGMPMKEFNPHKYPQQADNIIYFREQVLLHLTSMFGSKIAEKIIYLVNEEDFLDCLYLDCLVSEGAQKVISAYEFWRSTRNDKKYNF